MVKKKSKTIIFIIVLILGGLALANLADLDFFSVAVTSDTFVKPLFGRLECASEDFYTNERTHIGKSGTSVYCGNDELTQSCDFYVDTSEPVWWSGSVDVFFKKCNLDGTQCDSQFTKYNAQEGVTNLFLTTVPNGKKIFVMCKSPLLNIDRECDITKKYKAFKLFRFVGGAKYEQKAIDCRIPSSEQSKILQEDWSTSTLTMEGSEGQKWINYVYDWAYGPANNVFNHPQYGEVYCIAPNIYDIVELRTTSGTTVKLNPEYSGNKEDGSKVLGLGQILRKVECCPNEANCGTDFKFKPTPQPLDCTSSLECYNAGGPVPVDQTSYVTYSCISGTCIKSNPITVTCTNNNACPNGQICSLSATNYGVCVTQTTDYCGDSKCLGDENAENCPVDCYEGSANACIAKCEDIETGVLHPFGETSKQICYTKCDVYGFLSNNKLWIILGLITIGIGILFRKPIMKRINKL